MTNRTSDSDPSHPKPAFDSEALRAKYREERAKRLRADGNDQYVEVKGQFAHYLEDPYVEPGFARAALNDEVEVVVIGGGFGGLMAAARLREAGVSDIRVIEKGGDFGGTWYWNRYPGAYCDVESYIYLPFLEELSYIPVEKYAKAPEILAHSRAIGEHFDLYRNACFQTEVTQLRWNEQTGRWLVSTNRHDAIKARFVVIASGLLHRPKLPGIRGIEKFKGHSFHTSRWDYSYTGGDCSGGLVGLRDKRVALIGTGATAVQCVPHLGAWAREFYLFQRTPSSIGVRANRPTDPEWAAGLKPGWQQERMDNFNILVSGGRQEFDLVNDGWTDLYRTLKPTDADSVGDVGNMIQLADFNKMESIRARVDSIVRDRATAEALKPWYNQFCKRPCFHDEYLETFNRPNVHLIDTDGRGVEAITENSIVANGKAFEIDCLIYATGFEVNTSYARRSGCELYGRGGLSLTQKWAGGMATLHGMQTHGFPNCFFIMHAQASLTPNYHQIINEQSQHLAYILAEALGRKARIVEVKKEAEDAWVKAMIEAGSSNHRVSEECTPSYRNNEGRQSELTIRNGPYGRGPIAFVELLRAWRSNGELAGLELRK